MKVILTDNVAKVGKKYDVKDVAPGYGRNFLIPRGLARLATDIEMTRIEKEKARHEEQMKKRHESLLAKLAKIKGNKITIEAKANEEGHLYAGLGTDEIVEVANKEHALELEADWVVLDKPIKSVGEHEVSIKKNPFSDEKEAGKDVATLVVEVKALE